VPDRQLTLPIALALALTLLAVADAAAQFPGGAGGPPGGTTRGSGMGARGPAGEPLPLLAPASAAQQLRIHLGELEEDLKLAPAQRLAWSAYADRMRQLADDVVRARGPGRFPTGTAAQQLDALGDTARNRLTAVEDIVDAGKRLYALLTPEQREIADRRLARVALPLVNGTETGGARSSAPADDGAVRGTRR